MGAARRVILSAASGAALLALAVAVTEATERWRDWGCAGSQPAPCVSPAVWHWSDVEPSLVALGAFVGGAIAIALLALARRERRKRRDFGEE